MNLGRKAPASSMQKTYDECYLICSTAVYFESQNNEAEALRAWRNALDQIYYHNAYKIPSGYVPRTETERALQDSLRSMELQCKERVELLDALKKSREEATEDGKAATTQDSPYRNKEPLASVSTPKPSPKPESRSWLGGDTIPQTSYDDLPRPSPALPARPTPPARPSYNSVKSGGIDTPRLGSLQSSAPASLVPPPGEQPRRGSRTPSPEKKGGMLRTLRNNPKDRTSSGKMPSSLRGKAPTDAAKAASQVWSSGQRPSIGDREQSVSGNSGRDNTSTNASWDPYTRTLVERPASQGGENGMERRTSEYSVLRPPSPSDFVLPKRSNGSLDDGYNSRGYAAGYSDYPNLSSHSSTEAFTRNEESAPTTRPPLPPQHQSQYSQQPDSPSGSEKRPVFPQSLSHIGQAPPMSYMKEYPNHPPAKPRKPPEVAIREAANLAAGSGSRSGSRTAAASLQARPSPPIARKAVGRAAGVVNAAAERQRLDNAQIGSPSRRRSNTRDSHSDNNSSGTEAISSRSAAKPRAKAAVRDLTPPSSDELEESDDPRDPQKQAWNARVKKVLKDLPRNVDEAAAKQILNEIVIRGDEVHWDDVAGLEIAKSALKEAVVYPFLRPDLFMGLREPARGMLLFGPPGTGKTMLARAVATESRSVFFAISASSLTSKYLGESEKLVRALFTLAKALAPSIIFVDEIDSLLGSRGGSSEHEATRRIKTEFLIQWSDLQKAAAGREETNKVKGDASRVLVLAATNLPWAIDEAARRRFVRRQYIPLPEDWVREKQLRTLLSAQKHSLNDRDLKQLVRLTDGFSGSDITALAKDAAMGPLRSLGERLLHMSPDEIRGIQVEDFRASLTNIRPSVSPEGLKEFDDWARQFGERGG